MKNTFLLFLGIFFLIFSSCNNNTRNEKPTVLVFAKTAGYVHASIPKGIEAIVKLGKENDFKVDTTSNAANFNEDELKKYSAVIFLNTTGNVLDYKQEIAFERYIQSGGGFVGVHAATDTEYSWNWYGKLVGAYFKSHPKTQEAKFIIKDKNFGATSFFTDTVWTRTDELYNYKKMNPDVNVLITIDESSYEGGENGDSHPMSWYHEYDGGRSFYTELGHTDESYVEENYLKHLLGGIKYAIGKNEKLNYQNAKSELPPDEDRFIKTPLSLGEFFEPTEMTILPNLDILVAQRRGEIMLYKHDTKELSQVASFDVYHKTLNTPNVNAEEGVMGLQKDPNFATNNWVYIYYSPAGDKWVNRLSRFTFKDDVLDRESEKIILEVGSQREICCHTGGSIAFGPNGLLFLSTGDNSTPFNERGEKYVNSGYAPLNDTPGHKQYDARRSSGNTNDLRGKILRIKLNDDGTYDIPEGNLFPKGTDKARPEIYTMGHRNPYRISVDQKNGNLYWGDVGPDARNDSLETRGPRGYDEVGQARKAGNYGWPLFIADNQAYREYNYETGEIGIKFDVEKPLNNSRNNTGLVELPPGQSAFIWYPYVASSEFPQVGTGGRNAMAGPVYYNDMFPKETALPEYYNEKVIIYEWIRGWMKAVTLEPNGDFSKMEPFAPLIDLNNLIDMEVGPDGRIYLLEYGSGWFSKNDDSGLSYIDFNGGNRAPVIEGKGVEIEKTTGMLPFTLKAKVNARDREGDEVAYKWDLGNGTLQETTIPEIEYKYDKEGEYKISVEVKDAKGESITSDPISVFAGNVRPEVSIDVTGNKSFFIPGAPLEYKVSVVDAHEPGGVAESNIFVSVDYLEGMDEVSLSVGHQEVAATVTGKALTQAMDCKACHKESEKSVGPSFTDISKKYQNTENATSYLKKKIKEGGSGVWGEVFMAAHPDITDDELRQITAYILSLEDKSPKKESLPASGTIVPESAKEGESLVLTASYTDKGGNNVTSLTGKHTVVLASNTVSFSEENEAEGFSVRTFNNGNTVMLAPAESGWFAINNIDLTSVKSLNILLGWRGDLNVAFDYEVHLDTPDGQLIGKGNLPTPRKGVQRAEIPVKLESITDGKLHKVYFTCKVQVPEGANNNRGAVAGIRFE